MTQASRLLSLSQRRHSGVAGKKEGVEVPATAAPLCPSHRSRRGEGRMRHIRVNTALEKEMSLKQLLRFCCARRGRACRKCDFASQVGGEGVTGDEKGATKAIHSRSENYYIL